MGPHRTEEKSAMGHENSSLINRRHRAVAHTSRLGRGRNGPARLAPWGALVTAFVIEFSGTSARFFRVRPLLTGVAAAEDPELVAARLLAAPAMRTRDDRVRQVDLELVLSRPGTPDIDAEARLENAADVESVPPRRC